MAVIKIRLHAPAAPNPVGSMPNLDKIDITVGITISAEANGTVANHKTAETRMIMRVKGGDWRRHRNWLEIDNGISVPVGLQDVRLGGSNTAEDEPKQDTPGEDPWQDLWFYSNLIYSPSSHATLEMIEEPLQCRALCIDGSLFLLRVGNLTKDCASTAAKYVDAFMRNLDWEFVDRRFSSAVK
ncbi:hypothetical protein [Novosphingobium sp.]|uniref:hypothetical protein n=1 Tax=Novosphingobium sp. TaxID=1874826 RepID=UPI00263860A5|nr:hypothetical protein [Novosphingobium sp.]